MENENSNDLQEKITISESESEKERYKKIDNAIKILTVVFILFVLYHFIPNFKKVFPKEYTSFDYFCSRQSGSTLQVMVKFKNATKKDLECGLIYNIETYQNGIQLYEIVNIFDNSDNKMVKIEPNQTITVTYTFQLNNDSDVTIKGKEILTNDEVFRQKISVR